MGWLTLLLSNPRVSILPNISTTRLAISVAVRIKIRHTIAPHLPYPCSPWMADLDHPRLGGA